MREFEFIDLTENGKEIKCSYHGNSERPFEARLFDHVGSTYDIGISLDKNEIARTGYNSNRSFDIVYMQVSGAKAGVRCEKTSVHPSQTDGIILRSLLHPAYHESQDQWYAGYQVFHLPDDVKEINIYDFEF